ncbi:MAG: potassium-transporting ATPase subunit KdpC [Planctomycetaceae bacterium]
MKDVLTSLRLLVLSLLVCSVLYPLAVLAFAKTVVPEQSAGSLLTDERGTVIGSRLLAQAFTRPEYFWPRPSAVDYHASATGGSNLSPANPRIAERAQIILARFSLGNEGPLPADLVLASGSGMDPHITRNAAQVQMPRVAAVRGLTEEAVQTLIDQSADSPLLVALGETPLINVLELNRALDRLTGK